MKIPNGDQGVFTFGESAMPVPATLHARATELRLKDSKAQESPILESRFYAPPAYPRKAPIGRTLRGFRKVPAPGIGPDRID